MVQPCVWIRRETDEVKKHEKIKKYEDQELPTALDNIQKQLDLNTTNRLLNGSGQGLSQTCNSYLNNIVILIMAIAVPFDKKKLR